MPPRAKPKPQGEIIKVPTVPAKAYNPDRPASGLLRSHVEELEKAAGAVRGRPKKKSMTEGEAARHIRHLTRQFHNEVLAAEGPTLSVAPRAVTGTPPAKVKGRKKSGSSKKAARRPARSRQR